MRRLDAGEWLVRIDGALPAYISAGQYERNLARMAANRARAESLGAPRQGPALPGGLVVCAICGQRMQVSYERSLQGLTGRYCCQRRHHTYGEPRCQQMAARFLDDHVVAELLSALAPAALELSVTAARQVEARRAEVDRIWRQRLERADFLCDRARRQYQLAEPENCLVARQLEREWEAALAERAPGRGAPAPPAAAAGAAVGCRAGRDPRPGRRHPGNVGRVDDYRRRPQAAAACRHRIRPGHCRGGHRARPGHRDLGRRPPDSCCLEPPCGPDRAVVLIPGADRADRGPGRPGPGQCRDRRPARSRGFPHPPLHERFHAGEIQHLIRRLGLRPGLDHDPRTGQGSLGPGQWWLATLAREIGMPAATLFTWLKRGWITGQQDTRPPYRWIITADRAEVERLRALHRLPAGYHNRRRWTDTDTLSENCPSKEPDDHAR